jgi:hypothetical protein
MFSKHDFRRRMLSTDPCSFHDPAEEDRGTAMAAQECRAAKDCSLDVAWGLLQVHPQIRGCAEDLRQPQGGAGRNAAAVQCFVSIII